jgi:hypothetical protein
LARIEKKEKVVFEGKINDWMTEDMICIQDCEAEKNREIFGVRLIDASTRFLVDRFKVRWSDMQILFSLEKTC